MKKRESFRTIARPTEELTTCAGEGFDTSRPLEGPGECDPEARKLIERARTPGTTLKCLGPPTPAPPAWRRLADRFGELKEAGAEGAPGPGEDPRPGRLAGRYERATTSIAERARKHGLAGGE